MNLPRRGAKFCSQKCGTYYRRSLKNASIFPDKMTKMSRFVRFMPSKRPITVTGTSASSTNSATWTDYETARASKRGKGVGFVLGDGIGCIDLDHCIVDGKLLPWAQAAVDANPGTYTEISMSGEGLHIFGLLPEGPGRKIRDGRNIEVYSAGRYIALTGNRWPSASNALAALNVPA